MFYLVKMYERHLSHHGYFVRTTQGSDVFQCVITRTMTCTETMWGCVVHMFMQMTQCCFYLEDGKKLN